MGWLVRRKGVGGMRPTGSARGTPLLVELRASAGRRERAQKVAAAVVLLLIAAATGWAATLGTRALAGALFFHNPRYEIRRIDVSSTGPMKAQDILSFAHLAQGMNLFAVGLGQIRDDLKSVARIREVRVERQLPDGLVLRVEERTPVALFHPQEYSTTFFALDRDGFAFVPPASAAAGRRPLLRNLGGLGATPGSLVRDERVTAALDIIALCDDTTLGQHLPVAEIDVGQPDTLRLRLATGQEAIVPRENLKERLEFWANALAQRPDRLPTNSVLNLTGERNYWAVLREP
jgi:cell division septal protein FtsQ